MREKQKSERKIKRGRERERERKPMSVQRKIGIGILDKTEIILDRKKRGGGRRNTKREGKRKREMRKITEM